jgi:DNA-binding MarR family transcriptional regulator
VRDTEDVPDVGESLQAALNRILRWASRPRVAVDLAGPAGSGLSPTDLWLLDGVVRHGPLRISDVAAWQGVDKSTMTIQLRRLTERGLLARSTDPDDRRAVRIGATDEGRRLHADVSRHGAGVLESMLDDWDPDDRHALARLLTRFAERAGGPPRTR